MDRFETKSFALMPGQRVEAEVLSHHPWGVLVRIAGHEDDGLSASIDMIELFASYTSSHEELLALFPPVGSRVDAVVQRITRWHPPVSVRLSIRASDLEALTWTCDFCGERTTLSPGGDALVLDARSNNGPGSFGIVVHRQCLAQRIRPENAGERARALRIGERDSPLG
ncbi:hypothetical protein [Amycolatopsis sp. SID8362]|uniref:hypothetical protein n=1 Tax=Amycolatopsis sp. SID8362 TaxID=2690346 RepID=UPI00136AEF07|nr:hypothetical protein [Amycolatopsis sp. SID8362]NBH07749.1 hypothetical protein [Amycolatopsis sp. SID8362]NED44444.1 hypothetical protein [Amycolatopsis sp. SID8362]